MFMLSVAIVVVCLLIVIAVLYRQYSHKKQLAQHTNRIDDPPLFAHTAQFADIVPAAQQQDKGLTDLGFATEDLLATPSEPLTSTLIIEQATAETDRQKNNHLLIYLNVMAKDNHYFSGYELLQALLGADLRYGAMRIFHRHEYAKGQGKVLFSVASAVEPGTFDLSRIGEIRCPGLCLFLNVAKSNDPLSDFDLLLSTAYQLARDLDANIYNSTKHVLSATVVAELKQKISAWQQLQLANINDRQQEVTEV